MTNDPLTEADLPLTLEELDAEIARLDGLRTFTLDANEQALIHEVVRRRAQRRGLIVDLYPCRDCGAEAGRECKPDYGCTDATRLPVTLSEEPERIGPAHARGFKCDCEDCEAGTAS